MKQQHYNKKKPTDLTCFQYDHSWLMHMLMVFASALSFHLKALCVLHLSIPSHLQGGSALSLHWEVRIASKQRRNNYMMTTKLQCEGSKL
jgi:hypothetical protein